MRGFDAICHAMTTISTAGFSTHDASIGYFDSAAVDAVAVAGMLMGSLPFVLYLRALRGKPGALWRDSQVRWFFAIAFSVVAAVATHMHFVQHLETFLSTLHAPLTQVSSLTASVPA